MRANLCKGLLLAAVLLSQPLQAVAENSINLLRRNASVYDEDLPALLQRSSSQPDPIEIREEDPFFAKIIAQILNDTDALAGSESDQLSPRLEKALGNYQEKE